MRLSGRSGETARTFSAAVQDVYRKISIAVRAELSFHEVAEMLQAEGRKPLDLPEEMPAGERRRRELSQLRNIAMIEALLSSGMRVGDPIIPSR